MTDDSVAHCILRVINLRPLPWANRLGLKNERHNWRAAVSGKFNNLHEAHKAGWVLVCTEYWIQQGVGDYRTRIV